jgi:nucleotide-binding universal stress UspA family protein
MEHRYERLVVPVAGVPADRRVLDFAGQLVQKQPVALTLIYVVEVAQSMPLDAELPTEIARGEAALQEAETLARRALASKGSDVFTELLQARSVGAAVVDEAIERNADAVLMAAEVRRRHGRPTLGETIGYVLMNAPCEVIVLRRPMDARADEEPTWR